MRAGRVDPAHGLPDEGRLALPVTAGCFPVMWLTPAPARVVRLGREGSHHAPRGLPRRRRPSAVRRRPQKRVLHARWLLFHADQPYTLTLEDGGDGGR